MINLHHSRKLLYKYRIGCALVVGAFVASVNQLLLFSSSKLQGWSNNDYTVLPTTQSLRSALPSVPENVTDAVSTSSLSGSNMISEELTLTNTSSITLHVTNYLNQEAYNQTDDATVTNTTDPFMKLEPLQRSIIYVHTGKTGGDTLNSIFRANCQYFGRANIRGECLQKLKENEESLLSTLVHLTIHGPSSAIQASSHIKDKATTFLFTLRNPISRVVSAFNFDHPSNHAEALTYEPRILFYKCFTSIEELANILRERQVMREVLNGKNETVDCVQLGYKVLTGARETMYVNGHMYDNYGLYAKYTTQPYPEKEVFAIRTEELWEDVHGLNLALGGKENSYENVTGGRNTHGSEMFEVTSGLSKIGKETICCFLYKESEIYEHLLKQAKNIPPTAKEHSLEVLYDDCGVHRHSNFSWSDWAAGQNCTKI